jgi:hypothetical protein
MTVKPGNCNPLAATFSTSGKYIVLGASDHGPAGHSHDHAHHHHSHHSSGDDPEFEITLTAAQLSDLARFAATWSQIEFLMTSITALVAKRDPAAIASELESLGIDARADRLRSLVPQLPDDAARTKASDVCDRLGEIIPRRNHVMHGVWGLFIDRKENKALPACFYGRSRQRPVFASELPDITREAADTSRRLGALLGLLTPAFRAGSPPRRFFFSDGPPPAGSPPEWP